MHRLSSRCLRHILKRCCSVGRSISEKSVTAIVALSDSFLFTSVNPKALLKHVHNGGILLEELPLSDVLCASSSPSCLHHGVLFSIMEPFARDQRGHLL